MLGKRKLSAFIATKNPDNARKFYRDILGLRLLAATPFALVFEVGGAVLRVSTVAELTPAPYTVLGWTVPNLRAAMKELAAKGVRFERYEGLPQDAAGVWTSPD